jgi:hypothetical protein
MKGRKILAVLSSFVVILFISGTTGVTLLIHTCSSSHTTEISAFPEFISHPSNCCCEEDSPSHTIPTSARSEVNSPECCRNQHMLIKAPVIGVVESANHLSSVAVSFFLPGRFFELIHKTEQKLPSEYLPWLDHSPPPPGNNLIFFIHQIRIPFPAC